jgi:S-formylglutathione hydrolase FrmB
MRARVVVSLIVIAFALGAAAAAPARQNRTLDEGIISVALKGKVHARVILPAGYDDQPGRRYPVVYFLHGLPAGSTSYLGNSWLVRAMEAAGRAILVVPQGARDSDTDPEYLNWGVGRDWETYIAQEVPRYVDARFRTIRAARGRALIGVSAGGYGATVLGLHHPGVFSVVESWSGYFHPTDPTGTKALAREPAANVHTLVHDIQASRTWLGFYVGRGDTRFASENVELDRELSAAHVPHLFELYRGAHETSLWEAHAEQWLRLALAHLAR